MRYNKNGPTKYLQVRDEELIIAEGKPTFFYLNFLGDCPVRFQMNSCREDQGNSYVCAHVAPHARSVKISTTKATTFTAYHPAHGANVTLENLKELPCAVKVYDASITSYFSLMEDKATIDLDMNKRLNFKLEHVLETDDEEKSDHYYDYFNELCSYVYYK